MNVHNLQTLMFSVVHLILGQALQEQVKVHKISNVKMNEIKTGANTRKKNFYFSMHICFVA